MQRQRLWELLQSHSVVKVAKSQKSMYGFHWIFKRCHEITDHYWLERDFLDMRYLEIISWRKISRNLEISTTFHVNSENIELTEQNSINMRRRVSEKNENLLTKALPLSHRGITLDSDQSTKEFPV